MKKARSLLLFLFLVTPCWALEPGTSGADILKVPIGVRPTAMGFAYSAFGDDVQVLGYNPAGLARIPKYSLALDHQQGFADVQVEALSLAFPTKDYGNIGAQVVFRHMPMIDNELATDPPISAYDLMVLVSNAHQFGRFSVGASLKVVMVALGDEQALTQAVDVGIKVQWEGFDLAAVAQNLGPDLQFPGSASKDPLPLTFRAGLSRALLASPSSTLLASVEASHVRDEGFAAAFGAEYWHRSLLALRAGYRWTEGAQAHGGLSLGAALRHNLGRLEYEIGYAWRPAPVSPSFLVSTHSLGLLFWY
jgi:hypothetical protein